MQTLTASLGGKGTIKLSGAGALASTTLRALLLANGYTADTLLNVKNADIKVITGTIYIENDGTDADANSMPFDVGEKWEIRNCEYLIHQQIRIYAAAAYDFRVTLYT